MSLPSKRAVIAVVFIGLVGAAGMLAVVSLLLRLAAQRKVAEPSLTVLGPATNGLRLFKDRSWIAFSISNATPKTITYAATAVGFHTDEGWTSNAWPAASLMTQRETPAMFIPPGGSEVFYASIPKGTTPWRLHVSCSDTNWHFSWMNGKCDVISAEITP
jgi:hypothetical protein